MTVWVVELFNEIWKEWKLVVLDGPNDAYNLAGKLQASGWTAEAWEL